MKRRIAMAGTALAIALVCTGCNGQNAVSNAANATSNAAGMAANAVNQTAKQGADAVGRTANAAGAAASQGAHAMHNAVSGAAADTNAALSHWLVEHPRARSVDLTLVAGFNNHNRGFNFNGYSNGDMAVTVPKGWTVHVTFQNRNGIAHSAMIVPYNQHAKPSRFTPAFSGSSTSNPSTGVARNSIQTFQFKADKTGQYAIICGVPGHAAAGMWDVFRVSDTAKTPSLTTK
ncbi:hypothetical protein LLE49_07150 [Alicyclobacillus tolerans]|uniref:sulfocyanin-like copper-binding protein n=1 Tax=Alicyclobacillus tolerans TaxID=90970 RepID=UPI001F34BCEE|nr:sulfocyanin-like copper-binding protein [Alicyclobacillus tolerans]MCF8564520.1 hypothetical protein [Alicyclobacillus tolerans]